MSKYSQLPDGSQVPQTVVVDGVGAVLGGSAATVPTDAAVTVTTSSTQLLAANANRASGFLKNVGTVTVYLKQGATATTAHLPFNPGDSFKVTHQQAVNAITASGSATLWAEEENR